jgi:hypothetical protein
MVEGRLYPLREPTRRTEIAPESDHSHPFFQICVFQPSRAVDHHDDPVGRETLLIDE